MSQPNIFVPHYKREGNSVVLEFQETFYDRLGNRALLTRIVYQDKKNKFHLETVRVVWVL